MKMCEFECERAQKLCQILDSLVQLHYNERCFELRTEFNTQFVNVLAKANTGIHQANAAAVDAQRQFQALQHAEKTQSQSDKNGNIYMMSSYKPTTDCEK